VGTSFRLSVVSLPAGSPSHLSTWQSVCRLCAAWLCFSLPITCFIRAAGLRRRAAPRCRPVHVCLSTPNVMSFFPTAQPKFAAAAEAWYAWLWLCVSVRLSMRLPTTCQSQGAGGVVGHKGRLRSYGGVPSHRLSVRRPDRRGPRRRLAGGGRSKRRCACSAALVLLFCTVFFVFNFFSRNNNKKHRWCLVFFWIKN
jgi:hypothetical protein